MPLWRVDAHPNVEVRLFNPFVLRRPKWLGYPIDFFRLDRRDAYQANRRFIMKIITVAATESDAAGAGLAGNA